MIMYFIGFILLHIQSILLFNEGPYDEDIINKLINYTWSYPQEKVYLHTDKSFYVPGEDVWYKAYLMMGPYQVPDTISGVLYVEFINSDGSIIDRKTLNMRNGLGWGDFHLPETISPGKFIIKAYTRYMQNFNPSFHFRKTINVISEHRYESSSPKIKNARRLKTNEFVDNKPVNLRFFPEGGNMVEGLNNKIAFKAVDSKGVGKSIKGVIKNADGVEITTFESQKFGMGFFSIRPIVEDQYVAYITFNNQEYQYELPKAEKEGYVMNIKQVGDNIYIWVRNNMGINMDNSFVIGHFRGLPFITINAQQDQDFLYSVFNIKEIPNGIMQFTFFDSQGIPHCERLVYSENEENQINLNIGASKKIYRKREMAKFNIHCEDLSGNFPLTNLSLSIVNNEKVKKGENRSHIGSYFNLESDLKGFIENPGYYFNQDNEDRHELLDILLLTHGWRRFIWQEVLKEQSYALQFSAESGFNFDGELVDFSNRSGNQIGHVGLYIYEGQFYYNEIESDENGLFHFHGINIYDSTNVIMQAWIESQKSKKSKRKKLAIKLQNKPFANVDHEFWPDLTQEKDKDYMDFLDLNDLILQIDSSYDGRTIIMDEILIQDKKIDQNDPFYRPGKLHKNFTRRIVMDSLSVEEQSILLFDLVRNYYPNVTIRGMPPDVRVTIRGNRSLLGSNDALMLLDGQEVTSDFLYYFPVTEVAFIDILSSVGASMYGSGSMNGAIAVYTREGPVTYTSNERDWVLNFVHPGYYRAREFYYPNYGEPEEKHIKPDYRRILYWNPSLTTDAQGNIGFSFYTSDEEAEYRVEIEGMTYNGIPFTKEYYFSVE